MMIFVRDDIPRKFLKKYVPPVGSEKICSPHFDLAGSFYFSPMKQIHVTNTKSEILFKTTTYPVFWADGTYIESTEVYPSGHIFKIVPPH